MVTRILLLIAVPLSTLAFSSRDGADPTGEKQVKSLLEKPEDFFKKLEGLSDEQKTRVLLGTKYKFPSEVIKSQFNELDNDKKVNIIESGEITLPPDTIKNQLGKYSDNEAKLKAIDFTTIILPPDIIKDQLGKHKENEEKLKAIDFNTIGLPAEQVKEQFKKISDEGIKKETLTKMLSDYSDVERQALINAIDREFTYAELLQKPSESDCLAVKEISNPNYVGALPVVDFLNTAHFNSFCQPTMTNMLVNRAVFNDFNSFNQWGLWVEPFGFSTEFNQEADPLKFDLFTVGLGVGGEYTFFERLVLALGLAYSYSSVDWKESKSTAGINTLYLGPSLSYIFPKGYLGCGIYGVANFYNVHREIHLFKDKIPKPKHSSVDFTSLDLVGRLEGGLTYNPGAQFFIYPTVKFDYLMVFNQDFSEVLEEDVELKVQPSSASFWSTKMGVKVNREFFYPGTGFLIPSISGGWLYFAPLSIKSYKYQLVECGPFEKKVDVNTWGQYYLGVGFTLVHKIGVLFSLDYEIDFGNNSPLQAASLRAEWSW